MDDVSSQNRTATRAGARLGLRISQRRRMVVLALACVLGACAGNGVTGEEEEESLDPRVVEGCRTSVTPPAPRSRPLPGAVKVLPPENGAYAGLYTLPPSIAEYRRFKQKTGATPPIVFTFHDWVNDEYLGDDNPKLNRMSDPFPDSENGLTPLQFAEALAEDGAVLALAWAVYCCDPESLTFLLKAKKPWNIFTRILNGDFDNYIRTVAREIKSFGRPIMLSLTGEFNSQAIFMFGRDGTKWMTGVDNICNQYGDPTWPDGPERVRDTYRHVIDLFRDEGVRNVTWFIYASAHYGSSDPIDDVWAHPQYIYPGDDYIDWVGQSAFFVDAGGEHGLNYDDLRDLGGSIAGGYREWTSVTDKPLFLPEFAAMAGENVSRAALLRKVFREDLARFPRVKAVGFGESEFFARYFSVPQIVKSLSELEAWRENVNNNPYFVDKPRLSNR